jgi:hypothetical protein
LRLIFARIRSRAVTKLKFYPLISLFKNNSVYSLLAAIALFIILRVWLLTINLPLLVPELKWMLIGERMSNGFLLYSQIWDNISPLSALIYWVFDVLFGRSALAYHIFAILLIVGQTLLFHQLSQRNQLYHEKSNVPALLYVIFMCMSVDFYTLSPPLMGLTFLLLALDETFTYVHEYTERDEVFAIGFYTGIATLFYLPYGLFIGFELLCFLLLAATGIRKYFLIIVGFVFPLIIAGLFFYFVNGLESLYTNWLLALLYLPKQIYLSAGDLVLIAAPLLLILLLATQRLFSGDARFINYQIRCQQAMFMWLVTALVALLLATIVAPYQLVVFVPAAAFFGTHFFLLIRRWWIGELVFAALVLLILFINYSYILPTRSYISLETMFVRDAPADKTVQNKKLLVIGDDSIHYYAHNTPATPYLNWSMASRHFNDLDNYVTVIKLYENFQKDMPEVIVDKSGKAPQLFSRIPALGQYFEPTAKADVYVRKSTYSANGR